MLIRNILEDLSAKTYNIALSLYESNSIRGIESRDNTLTFLVQGQGLSLYRVMVRKSENGYSTHCNCRNKDVCEHMGVVLLYLGNNNFGLKNEKDLVNEMEKAGESISSQGDEIIQLDHNINNLSYLKSSIESLSYIPKYKNLKRKYKLVFRISIPNYYNPSSFIRPALRYIKLDGTYGRFERYDKMKAVEPYTKEEKDLLNVLTNAAGDDREDLLNNYIQIIKKNPQISLSLDTGHTDIPAKIYSFENVKISFKFSGFRNNEIQFRPVFSFFDREGSLIAVDDNSGINEINGISFIHIHDNGIILHKSDDIRFITFFSIILKSKNNITASDIAVLKEYIIDEKINNIEIRFDIEFVRIINQKPEPIIELFYSHGFLNIILFFKYEEQEIPYGVREDLIVLKNDHENEEILITKRSLEYERKVYDYINFSFIEEESYSYFEDHNPYSTSEYEFSFQLNIHEFLVLYGYRFVENNIEIRIKNDGKKVINSSGSISYSINSGIDWFEIEAKYQNTDGKIEDIIIDQRHIENGIIQTGENYRIITKKELELLSKLNTGGTNNKGKIRISKLDFTMIDLLYAKIENDDNAEFAGMKNISDKLKNFNKIEKYPLPKNFNGKLRKYQEAGYNWLHFMNEYGLNACLADDMGLGKTVQTLALLQSLKEKNELNTSLIVVPVTTIPNWIFEIGRFTKGLSCLKHAGQHRSKSAEEFGNYDLVISSYQTVRNDILIFNEIDFDYVILDESQNIKNPASKLFKAVKTLKAKHYAVLTGTPIENNTVELWSQMNFLNPGLLGNKKEFIGKYTKPIEKYGDKQASDRLKKLVFPFILRRKKEDVAKELPKKEEIIIYVEMDNRQRKIYENHRIMYKKGIEDTIEKQGVQKSSIMIFEALLRLRQLSLFPLLVDKKYNNIPSCKFDMMIDMVDEILLEDHKILVFSQFVKSLKIIEEHIKEKGIKYSYIDGSTRKRDKEISKFQENDDVKVFLLSIKAGGVGINLTAADYVILFDPWWNPAVESQAIDRSHRIGQNRNVIAYKLIVKGSIEEKILKLQEKKKKLVQDLITEESSFFKSLKKEDIIGLFE